MKFFNKLMKMYKWIKFLWNDFDFDYVYLLKIIKFKLEMMEPVIRNGYAESADATADEIKKTIELLELLIKDDFSENWSKLEKVYGVYSFENLKNGFTTINRTLVTAENREQCEMDTLEAQRLDEINKNKVKKALFRQLLKYENWWD